MTLQQEAYTLIQKQPESNLRIAMLYPRSNQLC